MGISIIVLIIVGEVQVLPLQLFFLGKPKTTMNPEQVAQICQILKSSGEEMVRLQSIDQLRGVEGVCQPMAIVALADSMILDKKAGIRAEAAMALSKMRPIRQEVGAALEKAVTNDPSMRVRIQARSALLQYNLAGYRSMQGGLVTVVDPLGQIARDPTPVKATTKNGLMAWFEQSFGNEDGSPKEVDKPAGLDNKKTWFRPGKNIVKWIQGATGSQEGPIKDGLHSTGSPIQAGNQTGFPPRLPNQVLFPVIPEFSPGPRPLVIPTNQEPQVGPELGNPKS